MSEAIRRYEVYLADQAQLDIEVAYQYISRDSRQNADQWLSDFYSLVARWRLFPRGSRWQGRKSWMA